MRKNLLIGSLFLLFSLSLTGCDFFTGGESNTNNSTKANGQNEEDPSAETPSEEDKTDYGRVFFKTIYIYADQNGNSFDEVPIRPIFTKPEVCQNEVFEYEIKNESICYIENDYVYATGEAGTTKVTAKSQHLTGTFIVNSANKFNNSNAFAAAKSLGNTASHTTQQGTTLFVGSSTFEFWRTKHNIDESFADAFAGFDVANVGISGTQAREWRSLRKKLIDPYEPENIIMYLGLNDIDDNSEDGESTAEYVMTLCQDIWDFFPSCNIYFCSIIRCTGTFSSKWTYHSQCNEIIRENTESYVNLHYLDIMGLFGDDYASYHQTDGIHLNTAGYEIIKNLIKASVPLKAK